MTDAQESLQIFLRPTTYLDCDHPAVTAFARKAAAQGAGPVEKAVLLYYAVRDQIRYDPYQIDLAPEGFKASTIIAKGYGYCVAKAVVLAAAARAEGIPSRLGFANVRNHLTTERLRLLMKTDEFIFHGYTELYLDRQWLKVTPTFNLSLCEKFGVKPLDFDGRRDALFHPYDREGRRHMEYVHDHGSFADLPYERLYTSFRENYPHFFLKPAGNFEKEAQDENPLR